MLCVAVCMCVSVCVRACVHVWEWQVLIICAGMCVHAHTNIAYWPVLGRRIVSIGSSMCVSCKFYSQQWAEQADLDYFISYNFSFILSHKLQWRTYCIPSASLLLVSLIFFLFIFFFYVSIPVPLFFLPFHLFDCLFVFLLSCLLISPFTCSSLTFSLKVSEGFDCISNHRAPLTFV